MKKLLAMLVAGCVMFGAASCGGNAADAPHKADKETKEEYIARVIEGMTPAEQAGQLIMTDFRQNPDGTDMTTLSEEAKEMLSAYSVGGVILFAENLDTAEQTKQLTADLQKAAEIGLLIGIDEEGGIVSRLDKSSIPHEEIPAAAEIEDAAAAGTTIGEELAELGINVDFAPVADVNTNPDNPVIGSRAFSADPETAAEQVGLFIEAMEQTGVSACAKHFPGHGDTEMDSHAGETYVEHDPERLKTVEFVPFRRAISKDVDFIMAGHIKTPNATADGLPASLSPELLGILRNDLDFEGIIITDAMDMGAIVEEYGAGESAVMAVQAGVDIVLVPADLQAAAEALTKAIEDGTISEERVTESLTRILSLKYEKGLL